MAHLTLVATADAIATEGLATPAEIDTALVDLARFSADPTTLLAEPRLFQVWATAAGRRSAVARN